MIRIVDQNHATRSVHFRVDSFIGKRDVIFTRIFFGLVAEDEDKLSGDIEAIVIVVVILFIRNAVPCEYDGSVKLAGGGKAHREEILAGCQRAAFAGFLELEAIVRAEMRAEGDGERELGRLQSERAELGGDVVRGLLKLGGTGGAAF